MKPIRVQRKRTKGWKMPENTVSVTRPGKWGNPFKIGHFYLMGDNHKETGRFLPGATVIYMEASQEKYADERYESPKTIEDCITMYERYLKLIPERSINELKNKLKGKSLACFCPLNKPCHADVLLKIVNQ